MVTTLAPSPFPKHRISEWTFNRTLVDTAVIKAMDSMLTEAVSKMVVDYLQETNNVYGEKEWSSQGFQVESSPSFPEELEEIWNSPCPFFKGKRVKDSHIFVYFSKTLNGQFLTLNTLAEVAKKYFPQNIKGYKYIEPEIMQAIGDNGIDQSYFVLMTKEILPDTLGDNGRYYPSTFVDLEKKPLSHYNVPTPLEAATCILAHYILSREPKKPRLFNDNPWTYTYCQKHLSIGRLVVGGFQPDGLQITKGFLYFSNLIGVSSLRRFIRPLA